MGTPSITTLINDYVAAFQRWVADVRELGKLEMADQGKKAGIGTGLFIGAAFFGLFAFALFTLAFGYVLVALGLPDWAAFAIEAVIYVAIAGILALVGKKQVENLKGPERTIAAIKAGPGIPLAAPEGAAAEEGPNAPPAA